MPALRDAADLRYLSWTGIEGEARRSSACPFRRAGALAKLGAPIIGFTNPAGIKRAPQRSEAPTHGQVLARLSRGIGRQPFWAHTGHSPLSTDPPIVAATQLLEGAVNQMGDMKIRLR